MVAHAVKRFRRAVPEAIVANQACRAVVVLLPVVPESVAQDAAAIHVVPQNLHVKILHTT